MNSYMSLIDWVIVIVPVVFVMGMGFYSRRYVRGVSDYLACGRVCGRYVLNMGDVANALSIIGLVAFIEIKYQTGFALMFWSAILSPLSLLIALTGFCSYRFRETRSMSLGQFLEIRYSRKLRVFGSGLRSLAEMLANMIMPAVAARFFIQMLNLPTSFSALGLHLPTFECLMLLFLTLAITLICLGGTMALVITDTIQGMILYPLLFAFVIFILCKFDWNTEVMPVMADRVANESFITPFDISKFRDFNVFTMVIVVAFNTIFHAATWIGAGTTTAAKSAHEQKMASILGSWRYSIINIFYLLVALCLIVFLNHMHFAGPANEVRQALSIRVADDVIKDNVTRDAVKQAIAEIQPIEHQIGIDPPLSQENNIDTQFLAHIHQALRDDARTRTQERLDAENAGLTLTGDELAAKETADRHALIDAEGKANDLFQQCRTLFNQLSLSVTMKHMLPTGLFGAFCLLLFLAMLSSDDTRIFSATLSIAQDIVLPFFPKGLTPKQHVRMIRIVAISIGVFFFFGSKYMAQLDYIQLFVTLATAIWNSGCCPVMIFGLYWKKGTTQAAWTSLIVGIILSVSYMFTQRNWADIVYPFLAKHELVDFTDKLLRLLSAPFGDWISWKMDPVKFPINSIEFLFFSNLFSLALYAVISWCTCKVPFNMDRMLHRGEYADPNEPKNLKRDWSLKGIFKSIIGITPEYTKGDRVIAYSLFIYSFIYSFVLVFVVTLIWNLFTPWPIHWWSKYFLITQLVIPGITAAITAIWYGIGGIRDLRDLFRALEKRKKINILDDGRVEGNVNLADQAVKTEESEEI